jgi:hypothetical protein
VIPPFSESGLLPPDPMDQGYDCSAAEVEQRLVVELGSPDWRVRLFQGWEIVRRTVSELVPTARWWLWGCFISSHLDPLWGEDEVLSSLVILPVADLPKDNLTAMLVSFLQVAPEQHYVDAAFVFDFAEGSDEHLETIDALEFKWRPRAILGVADHATGELEPAGFLEIVR